MSVTRKLFEISCDDEEVINDIASLFKGKDTIANLNIYKTKLDTFILLAEFSAPIRVKLDEDPFKKCEVETVKSFDKRSETLAEENTEISSLHDKKTKSKEIAKKPKKQTAIEEKLDRIIELLEQMKK